MNPNIVALAVQNLRAEQSNGKLRKESNSSLITLLGVILTIITTVTGSIPDEYGWLAAALTGVAAAISYYIDRFTVPAFTNGQQKALEAEAQRLAPLVNAEASLPVYDEVSTLDESVDGGSTIYTATTE